MYAVHTITQERPHCYLAVYKPYMPHCYGVVPVRPGKAPSARSNPLRYVTSARRALTRSLPTAPAA